ncbi:AraC-type DNA-binding protein [Nonomuraea solani]|uniref:AraC-type DNA-binding protein n=1 Tax=Nonomuraea solani TaxID=1144553 RepID=A0A1H5W114_9ACTN|nr:helix-turn-helix domain-containing protein [Nonomuraea solani]SEF92926.1 AraC-type DNA-binding protein [Nonomuraea solani]
MIGTMSGAGALASLLDLIAAILVREPTAEHRFETRRDSQLARVRGYIQENLADPRLSPKTIATAHHMSVRSLHRLFAGQDTTVASWIRNQRLERCRHDLTDPALRDRPIHAIAGRWGFPSHAHFTRAFRTAYGMSPLEHRHGYGPPRPARRS